MGGCRSGRSDQSGRMASGSLRLPDRQLALDWDRSKPRDRSYRPLLLEPYTVEKMDLGSSPGLTTAGGRPRRHCTMADWAP